MDPEKLNEIILQIDIAKISLATEEEPSIIISLKDITERKRTEMQLTRSRKLASIGLLAAGVAHEINNPATFVNVNAVTMEKWWKLFAPIFDKAIESDWDGEPGLEKLSNMVDKFPGMIQSIKEGTLRISSITRGLTHFARSDHEKIELVDIRQALETAMVMAKIHYKNHADLVIENESAVPKIYANMQKLEQMFLNLITNASDAIEEKINTLEERDPTFRGRISIIITLLKRPERSIEILVKDNGIGMEADVIEKVFDPFFTTKRVRKGTGLGMSIVYGIIQDHGGDISVESTKGEGSAFTVTMPLDRRKATSEEQTGMKGKRG